MREFGIQVLSVIGNKFEIRDGFTVIATFEILGTAVIMQHSAGTIRKDVSELQHLVDFVVYLYMFDCHPTEPKIKQYV